MVYRKILFIINNEEQRELVTFIDDMLVRSDIDSSVWLMTNIEDSLSVIKEYNPSHVFIEGSFINPTDYNHLPHTFPKVKFIIRLLNDLTFTDKDNINYDWLPGYYSFNNTVIGVSSTKTFDNLKTFLKIKNHWVGEQGSDKVQYLPNYYPIDLKSKIFNRHKDTIDISFFGHNIPLKKYISNALVTVNFVNHMDHKQLRFYINSNDLNETDLETLKNVFNGLYANPELVECKWKTKEEFIEISSQIDIALGSSFSNNDNLYEMIMVSQGTQLITSNDIPWVENSHCINTEVMDDIFVKYVRLYEEPYSNIFSCQGGLRKQMDINRDVWLEFLYKNKIAIFINGQFREFDTAVKSWGFLEEFDYDIYVSTWNKSKQVNKRLDIDIEEEITIDMITKHFPNAKISILNQDDYEFPGDVIYHNGKQIFHWKNCLQMSKESGVKYDQIMLIRPDDYLFYNEPYEHFYHCKDGRIIYGQSKIHISPKMEYFLPDYFFFGNSVPMSKMIETLSIDMPGNIHTELALHILSLGFDVFQISGFDLCLVRPTIRGIDESTITRELLQEKWEEWGNNTTTSI
jgi:hypothetical protein